MRKFRVIHSVLSAPGAAISQVQDHIEHFIERPDLLIIQGFEIREVFDAVGIPFQFSRRPDEGKVDKLIVW